MRLPVYVSVLAGVLLSGPALSRAAENPDPQRFAEAIAEFEAADREHPPEPGMVLFVGSSSIRRWELDKSFPELNTLNRGFGGSHFSDAIYFAERVFWPYQPRAIVLYEGDNDIGAEKSPEQVADDFCTLLAKIRQKHADVPVVVVGIKPSLKRWHLREQIREANRLIQQAIEEGNDEHVTFVDVEPPMLGTDGTPRPELFVADGLHMTDEGYEIWANMLRPLIAE